MANTFSAFRKRLEDERERLLRELKSLDAPIAEGARGESAGYGNHMADDASETFELEKDLALERNLRHTLSQVEHALHKFSEGTYGLCEQCGLPINPERLEALPHATLCIACKAKQKKAAVS